MTFYRVPNGKQSVKFTIPTGTDVTVVETNPLPLLVDPVEAVRRETRSSRPLDEELRRRPGARVIIIPDALLSLPIVKGG